MKAPPAITVQPQRLRCGVRPGTPHEPHGTCPGTAPEYLSERVMASAEASALTCGADDIAPVAYLDGGQR